MKILYVSIVYLLFFSNYVDCQWFPQNSDTDNDFLCVFFSDTQNGWVGSTVGLIYKTTNGGESWNPYSTNSNMDVVSIQFFNRDTGWCVSSSYYGDGRGEIYKTIDGGLTWVKKFDGPAILKSVFFINKEIGWTVGAGYYPVGNQLLKTTDSGNTWDLQFTFDYPLKAMKVLFLNEQTGFVVGRDGLRIWKTNDGGSSWNSDTLFNRYSTALDISFTDDQKGIVATQSYYPIRTNNGGETWGTFDVNGFGGFYGVEYRYPDIWLISNSFGRIINSANDGIDWFPQTLMSGGHLNDICFVNDTVGWAVGFDGKILKTINGGVPSVGSPQTLVQKFPENDVNLTSIPVYLNWDDEKYSVYQFQLALDSSFTNIIINVTLLPSSYQYNDLELRTYYWRVRSKNLNGFSEWSEIRNFTMTDLVNVNDDGLLSEFSLNQNYPNPFNPTTKIGFRIANFGLVALKVYDVLGKEVATLVNEDKSAGNYEVEFDASSLPSGVYLYQLQAGDYIKTNKMILLK